MTTTMENTQKEKPVFETRLGDIKGVIWMNQNDEGRKFYSPQIVRVYKDESTGELKDTPSYRPHDLKLVKIAADEMTDFITSRPLNS